MPKRQVYDIPPIVEALCEFRFEPGQEWDLTMPGKLHNKIKNDYPAKPRQQKILEAGFFAVPNALPQFTTRETSIKVQLLTQDENRLVSVGTDQLSVHMLRPYQDPNIQEKKRGWVEFRSRIENALTHYWDVAEPKSVRRIGVRFINRLRIPEASFDKKKYFLCGPADVPGLPRNLPSYFSRTEYTYDANKRLVLTHATVDNASDVIEFILDLDAVWIAHDKGVDRPGAVALVEDLRQKERDAFEAVITDETRRLMNEGD